MPVRKIPKNYRNVTGIAAYRKAQGQAMFESTLERDFITLLEFDPLVDAFEVQPLKVNWHDGARNRSYTPDLLVYYTQPRHPTTLFEVKYRSDLRENWADFKPKFKAARAFAKEKGWKFKLITEREIRSPYLSNAKFLMAFANKGPISETDMDILDEAIRRLEHSTPAELLGDIYQDEWNRARLLPSLWYLIGIRHIATDLTKKLTMTSPIWRLNA